MSKIKRLSKKRLVVVLIMACVVFFMLIFRTGYLQIVKGDWLTAKALDQQTRDIPIEPKRGTIYDKNMKELAVSVTKYTVWAKPVEVKDKEKSAKIIAQMIGEEYDDVLKLLKRKDMALVKVKRWIDDETAAKIRDSKLPGIWVAEDNQRYYPYGNFASYVLGHTSDDATGIAGIEMQYDKHLKGKSGRLIVSTDASGREIPHGMEKY
ncbi:MAG: stage V sporulation protein D, partial [Peptostreptococcaceae bacterium]